MAYSDTELTSRTPDSKEHHQPGGPAASARGQVEGMKESAKESGERIKGDLQHLTAEARERGRDLLQQQRQSAADNLGGMAEALRDTARHLEHDQQPNTARYVQRAADTVNHFADVLRTKDVRSMLNEVQNYARQHPGAFIGGSVLAGFLMVRFLKSSSQESGGAGFGETSQWAGSAGAQGRAESDYVF